MAFARAGGEIARPGRWARTLGAIERLTRESPGKTILVVGHAA